MSLVDRLLSITEEYEMYLELVLKIRVSGQLLVKLISF